MDAAGLDPTTQADTDLATERARMLFAAACNGAAHQPGLPLHERAGYLAMRREAVRLATGEAELTPVLHIGYSCTDRDDPIRSRPVGERTFGRTTEELQRGPMMEAPNRDETPVGEWEAHAEFDLGLLIGSYLRRNPPPVDSHLAVELDDCARDFEVAGRAHLAQLGRGPLRLAPRGAFPTRR
jgi:hypothetical protein